MRVFYDRLADRADQEWFEDITAELCTRYLKQNWTKDDLFGEDADFIMFADFLKGYDSEVKLYEEVKEHSKLESLLDDCLDDYNAMFPTQMNLVFFEDAIVHLGRCIRLLRQPRGNAMLVGVGGSGKQSTTRMAAFISQMDCIQISISRGYGLNEFRLVKKFLEIFS